jgi:acyl dehydratase
MRTLAALYLRDWQFKEPVFVGDTLRVISKVLDKEVRARGRRGVITWQRQILNQERKVVQEGVSVTLVEGRGMHKEDTPEPAEPGNPE